MLTGTTSRKRKYDVLTQVEYGLYYPSDIPSDREGNWNAGDSLLGHPDSCPPDGVHLTWQHRRRASFRVLLLEISDANVRFAVPVAKADQLLSANFGRTGGVQFE
jgi:hypothetical protein